MDFDESSIQWRANKKSLGNGMFAYCCHYIHSTGKRCRGTIEAQHYKYMYDAIHPEWQQSKIVKSEEFCKRHRSQDVGLRTRGIRVR